MHQMTVITCRVIPDPSRQQAEGLIAVRESGTLTRDVLALADWLTEAGITYVAMESTGEYWKPIFNIWEGTYEVFLVNAAHVKNVPGRKTDRPDACGLARHGCGVVCCRPASSPRPSKTFGGI
jgi:transposase